MRNLPEVFRSWRRAEGLKQSTVASLLGVTQATVSRWESGKDEPAPQVYAKIRSLIGSPPHNHLAIHRATILGVPGIRALVDLDGIRLLSSSASFKALWPQVAEAEGHKFAENLVEVVCDIYNNQEVMKSITNNEIAMISAVSDRQISGYGDHKFRHYWAAVYKKIGSQHVAEISFEACAPDAELGIRNILRVDEIE